MDLQGVVSSPDAQLDLIENYVKRKVQFLENWNKVIGFQVIILVIWLLSDS